MQRGENVRMNSAQIYPLIHCQRVQILGLQLVHECTNISRIHELNVIYPKRSFRHFSFEDRKKLVIKLVISPIRTHSLHSCSFREQSFPFYGLKILIHRLIVEEHLYLNHVLFPLADPGGSNSAQFLSFSYSFRETILPNNRLEHPLWAILDQPLVSFVYR